MVNILPFIGHKYAGQFELSPGRLYFLYSLETHTPYSAPGSDVPTVGIITFFLYENYGCGDLGLQGFSCFTA